MDPISILQADMLQDINISVGSTILALLFSCFNALILRYLYITYGRSMNNREYFGNIFVLLSVTTCAVIIIVKYSLALSLGLVGALSIVRFRAAIKEPEELVYLFLTIAFGLAYGSNQFVVGFVLLVVASITIVISDYMFSRKTTFEHTGLVVIIEGSKNQISSFRSNSLEEVLPLAKTMLLKEISYQGENGRLVLRSASIDVTSSQFIDKVQAICIDQNLNMQIISDVTVPA